MSPLAQRPGKCSICDHEIEEDYDEVVWHELHGIVHAICAAWEFGPEEKEEEQA